MPRAGAASAGLICNIFALSLWDTAPNVPTWYTKRSYVTVSQLRPATPRLTPALRRRRRRRRRRRYQLKENTAEMFGIELAAEYEYKFSSAKVGYGRREWERRKRQTCFFGISAKTNHIMRQTFNVRKGDAAAYVAQLTEPEEI